MNQQAREVYAMMDAIMKNPRDVDTRKMLADWLDENDEPELAQQHRKFELKRYDAEQWLKNFCMKYEADYDELLDSIKNGDGYCFGDDNGPYAARDNEFWENVQIVLEVEFDEEARSEQSFRCAC